ncbi:hypothetical protein QQZ08_009530 [Neonectria magnoliae]|uniref:Uncharacterized protein n=1 Tax=Neonectria magnoliae TaxID=2732573 RepID=A0ABR1HM69_9HYPO
MDGTVPDAVGAPDPVPMVELPVGAEEFVAGANVETELTTSDETSDVKVKEPLMLEDDSTVGERSVNVLSPELPDLEIVTVMFIMRVVVVVLDEDPVSFAENDTDWIDWVCSAADEETPEETPVAVPLDSNPAVRLETTEIVDVIPVSVRFATMPEIELAAESVDETKAEEDAA